MKAKLLGNILVVLLLVSTIPLMLSVQIVKAGEPTYSEQLHFRDDAGIHQLPNLYTVSITFNYTEGSSHWSGDFTRDWNVTDGGNNTIQIYHHAPDYYQIEVNFDLANVTETLVLLDGTWGGPAPKTYDVETTVTYNFTISETTLYYNITHSPTFFNNASDSGSFALTELGNFTSLNIGDWHENQTFENPYLTVTGYGEPPFPDGDGSEGEPYQITKIEHLYAVRDYLDSHFILMNDLDFENDSDYEDSGNKTAMTTGGGWLPIGNRLVANFTGSFDGNGKTISNLYSYNVTIAGNVPGGEYPGVGLFGAVDDATIYNLALASVNVTGVQNDYYTGGFVGYVGGDSHIYNCSVSGLVSGLGTTGGFTGGFVGIVKESALIENCFSTANVSGYYYNHGGFVGSVNSGDAINCYSTGTVTRDSGSSQTTYGGFAGGENNGNVTNCYSTGAVVYDGTSNPTDRGFSGSAITTESGNFWDTETSGQSTSQCSATGKTTAQMKDFDTFNDAGWDIAKASAHTTEVWFIDDGVDYPRLFTEDLPADTDNPTYSDLSTSTTEAGASCQFNATFNDDVALEPSGQYQFGTNNTGAWVWDDAVAFTSTPQTVSVSKTLNSTYGQVIGYRWNITDNVGHTNSTAIYTLTTTDVTAPEVSSVDVSSTLPSSQSDFTALITDNSGLAGGGWIFSWNGTSVWQNSTWTEFTTNPELVSTTKGLPATSNTVIGFCWYYNDTRGNWGQSEIHTITTSDTGHNPYAPVGDGGEPGDNGEAGDGDAGDGTSPPTGTTVPINLPKVLDDIAEMLRSVPAWALWGILAMLALVAGVAMLNQSLGKQVKRHGRAPIRKAENAVHPKQKKKKKKKAPKRSWRLFD